MSLLPRPSILIVEDEVSLQFLLRNRLKKTGYQVDLASDAEEALRKISAGFHPHLILTDLNLPRLKGLDLIRHLKQQNITIPFILMTGSLDERNKQEALELGALEIFTKPFSYRQMIVQINQHLQTAPAPGAWQKSG